jgi:hypothetical protein
MTYKLNNGKEVTVPQGWIRISHFLATIGGQRMELVDGGKDNYYMKEIGENRMWVLHFSKLSISSDMDMCVRCIQTDQFHIRYHESETEKVIEELSGE